MEHKKFFGLAIFWTIVVTYLSLTAISGATISLSVFKHQDKLVHFSFYFIFTIIWFFALKPKDKIKKTVIILAVIAILYGIFMEVCQGLFTNYRSPDLLDVLANSLGAIAAAFLLMRFKLKNNNSQSPI